jgi:hypothetical protein
MKRHCEINLDSSVVEGLKLIRYTTSHMIKKLEARLPKEDEKEPQLNLFTVLANLPRLMSGAPLNGGNNPVNDKVDFIKDCGDSQIQEMIEKLWINITDRINHFRIKNRKISGYGIRVRKA